MTRAEEERRAQLWNDWLGPPDSIARYGAPTRPLPPELNWQHNADAPLPPGLEWARCLCFAVPVRPPAWHGQVRDKRLALRYSVGPAVTYRHWDVKRSLWQGSVCDSCGAPLQRVDHPHDPYPWPFETPSLAVANQLEPCDCHPVSTPRPRPRLIVVEGGRGRKVS